MKLTFLLVAMCLAICAFGKPVELTQSDFAEKTADGKVYFIKFFAPWCGHCKRLAPTWEELAGKHNVEGSDVVVATVDCTKHKEVCTGAEIKGYPTLKVYHGGEAKSKYSGARTLEALGEYVEDQLKLLTTETVA